MTAFRYTTAIKKIRAMEARKKVIQGGTSAGKTYGVIPVAIDHAIKNKGSEISIVSESIPHLRRGAMKDFLKIMQQTGRFNYSRWNRTLLTYTFANGSFIEFFSATDEAKLRGARRTDLYVNEANNITFDEYHQLAVRTSGNIWLDFNPTFEFWAHREVLQEKDSELLILTYEDNEALPANVKQDMDAAIEKAKTSEYWANWVSVYVYGQIGTLRGTVYTHWKEIDTIPEDARLERVGLDFGYTNDPTAAIAVYKWNNTYILDQLIYETGLVNQDIAKMLKDEVDGATVIADSAEPKSIRELKRGGVRCLPSQKGRDSVANGIQIVQGVDLYVTKRSTDLKDEFRKYRWREDREGNTQNVPVDAFNHGMDATRYAISDLEGRPNRGKYLAL